MFPLYWIFYNLHENSALDGGHCITQITVSEARLLDSLSRASSLLLFRWEHPHWRLGHGLWCHWDVMEPWEVEVVGILGPGGWMLRSAPWRNLSCWLCFVFLHVTMTEVGFLCYTLLPWCISLAPSQITDSTNCARESKSITQVQFFSG